MRWLRARAVAVTVPARTRRIMDAPPKYVVKHNQDSEHFDLIVLTLIISRRASFK